MLVGIFLRNFKTYGGINFIPLTDDSSFCGLLGDNGAGKSSVLEALDCLFNHKTWTYNIAVKKQGLSSAKPYIVPVFLVAKESISSELIEAARRLSDFVLTSDEDDIAPPNRGNFKSFRDLLEKIRRNINLNDYHLLPLGKDHEGNISLSIFNTPAFAEKFLEHESNSSLTSEHLSRFKDLLEAQLSGTNFLYIPREIDPETFTKLETKEIQVLMGETLQEILEKRVTRAQITGINNSLTQFIDELSEDLGDYAYRTPTDRQTKLKRSDVYNLIIEAFFSTRKLHKNHESSWLELKTLSSGEKQRALIDVAHRLIQRQSDTSNLVIGIDEPESSLHMSACFEQFRSLHQISQACSQVIFASHWYGFLPAIESGSVTVITKRDDQHFIDQVNLANYREQIKQAISHSKKKLPYDIRLKSINDFVQSIVTSTINSPPFNWLICEGSSEVIYLSHYLSNLIEEAKLRIVPVGGANEIKRIYNHLLTCHEDFKDEIKGKIYLLSDTDAQLVSYETKQLPKLLSKRLINRPETRRAELVNIGSNPVSPKTAIEDVLNGKRFLETLQTFTEQYPEDLPFTADIECTLEASSYFGIDLKQSQREALDAFFNKEGVKYEFAKRYVKGIDKSYEVPHWITDLKAWFSDNS